LEEDQADEVSDAAEDQAYDFCRVYSRVVLDAGAQYLDEEGREDERVEGEDGGFCKGEHGGGFLCDGGLWVARCLAFLSWRDGFLIIANIYVAVWIAGGDIA
jgi:hypothetical protein